MTTEPIADFLVRYIAETMAMHKPWHFLVPQSVSDGWGWCLDCQRTVHLDGTGVAS